MPERRRPLTRLGATAALAGLAAVATMVAAVVTVSPAPAQVGRASPPPARVTGPGGASARAPAPLSAQRHAARSTANAANAASAAPSGHAAPPLTLTAADRRGCPPAATACVDLVMHLTWLQSAGQVTYGPVQMEPGQPGSRHQTPRGTFHVAWKAGPGFVSDVYHEPMPWATFFAAGGIAFHGGSLTQWSHGCVHLSLADARYYNAHLPVGAEVIVF